MVSIMCFCGVGDWWRTKRIPDWAATLRKEMGGAAGFWESARPAARKEKAPSAGKREDGSLYPFGTALQHSHLLSDKRVNVPQTRSVAMLLIVGGVIVVLASVVAGFLLENGQPLVLFQPAEFLIICGGSVGILVAGNP